MHWHVDISYLNLGGTFYFLISVLDGFSRYIVHWEIRDTMKKFDIEVVIAKAMEKHPGVRPRIISNNGPQLFGPQFFEAMLRRRKLIAVNDPGVVSGNQRLRVVSQFFKNLPHPLRSMGKQTLANARVRRIDFVIDRFQRDREFVTIQLKPRIHAPANATYDRRPSASRPRRTASRVCIDLRGSIQKLDQSSSAPTHAPIPCEPSPLREHSEQEPGMSSHPT